MRQVLPGDLVAAALVLRALPEAERDGALRRLLEEADLADRYRKRLGRPHPDYGNGSLMAAALRHRPGGEPFLSDPAYLDALGRVIAALRARRARHDNDHKMCSGGLYS
ncbi:DUF7742 family protein [Acidimangrovimonas pyrenivorans]|uniref:DUF7742 domain-containing protein n=1 Tax=Acidimangrovimonas pyrenivorans TaxID=2030798 RepID=A0ABV7AFM2_9RHOB